MIYPLKRIFLLLLLFTFAETVYAQKKNGRVSIADAQGTVSEGKMKRGEKNGEWKTTSKFGKLLTTETYVNGQAGSIYKQHIPLANANFPPGEWNVYDIAWTAPRFNDDGSLKSPAMVTAFLNGVFTNKGPGPIMY